AGSAIVCDARGIDVFGAEPEMADDAYRSLTSGERVVTHVPNTIADGLLTTLGERNFDIIKDKVDDILLVSETEIVDAMSLLWTRMKIVVEPSAAVTLAAILRYADRFAGKRVGAILTGGNVDLGHLPFTSSESTD
ncbi:MAG TPA: pyridoxal-phosphate dependent enzyme, partial [Pseudomonadales bacterium]|nr:pyridoxal-phosphate dependent enzyme [Pseudomonadales bacterium]